MSTSAINATCNAVAIADAAAIVGLYLHFNKRINVLENGNGIIRSSGLERSKSSDEPLDVRVMTLENEITVLLQRLQVYDELFLKMMNRMKEMGPIVDRFLEESPSPKLEGISLAKKTAIRRRSGISLMARKEPFIDADTEDLISPPVDEDDPDDELFSFLKD